jgi:hypothetical protein
VSGFQDQQDAIKRKFSSSPATSPIVSCPKGALTAQQAQERFDKFKCREDIPWDYPQDCCYNRAHVMAKELQAEGVDVGKVWNYAPPPDVGGLLRVGTPNDPKKYVEWGYHVAPTVPVMDAKGGICRMVIDPSITNTPITPDQWKALQGQPLSELVQTNAAPYYRNEKGRTYAGLDPTNPRRRVTDQEVEEVFNRHRRARTEIRRRMNAGR